MAIDGKAKASRHRWAWQSVAAVVTVSTVVAAGLPACSQPSLASLPTPFSPSSPWRQELPSNPPIDPGSAAMIAAVQPEPALYANLVEFGIPIYETDSNTPSHAVNCTVVDFGECPFDGWQVLIPDAAVPNSGSDGVLVTVDESRAISFEFWRAVKSGNKWSTSFGAVNSLSGSGWGGAATGSGASRLAGVIRLEEIAAGVIPHVLALQTSNACNTFRPPALKSDGDSTRADCLPEGARLQLDPSLDLSKLNLSAGEMAVATAMQRFGGYVMDVSGAPLSVSFELDTNAAPGTLGTVYQDAGFRWDYDAMERIPWDKLRVLK
ncbi:hypothetical protein ACIA48_17580 [Mycobacterium sp. NPDC051804]|uniref:hypothetical protein n=1 Tax=Mycobacterium sp. NPDC051804 TaxID=3364295 RepID=UPI003796BF7F